MNKNVEIMCTRTCVHFLFVQAQPQKNNNNKTTATPNLKSSDKLKNNNKKFFVIIFYVLFYFYVHTAPKPNAPNGGGPIGYVKKSQLRWFDCPPKN